MAPLGRLRLVAIAGSKGKSSTAFLLQQIMQALNVPTGLIRDFEYSLEQGGTAKQSERLPTCLGKLADSGCRIAILEVSSHALRENALAGLELSGAVFTNFFSDSLDYVSTVETHRKSMASLFHGLPARAVAVLNMDSREGDYFAMQTGARVLRFSANGHLKADLRGHLEKADIQGTRFSIDSRWGSRRVQWKVVGTHNIGNALAALGMAMVIAEEMGQTPNLGAAVEALENVCAIPEQLELVRSGQASFQVRVDSAHTAESLQHAIRTLRGLGASRVIVVFGCGGDRDRTKRPLMGRVVEQWADVGVITSDNPRTESFSTILSDIWAGIERRGKFAVEPNRARAIELAIRQARPGDVVLIAGKGCEEFQINRNEKRRFSDREEATLALLLCRLWNLGS
jgi:UDP-N-acetylmuramoyl-L-alanyl-D-glutamate--2,6-diaminopimelate ligase